MGIERGLRRTSSGGASTMKDPSPRNREETKEWYGGGLKFYMPDTRLSENRREHRVLIIAITDVDDV